jgi:hypothetical protein
MAALVPCLVQLRTDVNGLCPGRDKTTDGWIGNPAHQASVSDHNDDEVGRVPIRDADSKHEVHALDLDVNLRTAGLTMEMIVQHVVSRCRTGAERRLRYVIYNRRIWEASNGWRQRAYSGDSPHTGHAHFSASYDSLHEASTASWRLEDIPVALTDADKKWLADQIDKAATNAAARTWATKFQRPGEEPGKTTSAGAYQSYTDVVIDRAADRVITEVTAVIKAVDQSA